MEGAAPKGQTLSGKAAGEQKTNPGLGCGPMIESMPMVAPSPSQLELDAEPYLAQTRVRGGWRLRARPHVWATSAALRVAHVVLDFVAVFVCYYAAFWLVTDVWKIVVIVPWAVSPLVPLVLAPFVLFFMHWFGIYRDRRFRTDPGEWLNVVVAVGLGIATALVFSIVVHIIGISQFSRRLVLADAVVLSVGLLVTRQVMRTIRANLRRRGMDVRRVMVVGSGENAVRVREHMRNRPANGMECAGLFDLDRGTLDAEGASEGGEVAVEIAAAPAAESTPASLPEEARLAETVARLGVDEVIVAWPEAPLAKIIPLLVRLDHMHVRVRVLHPSFLILSERLPMNFETVHGVPIVDMSPSHGGPIHSTFKHVFDFVFGAIATVVSLPVWLLIALVIRLQDGGPAFYRQRRVARGGRTFELVKFRTMIPDAERQLDELLHLNMRQGPMFKMADDPRCTPFGRWLRRYRLDELPQFLNVLRGEINVIGTRPPLVKEVEQYRPWHAVRLRRWVGITGLWQICGRDDVTFDEVVLFDLFYERNANFFLDVAILFKTTGVVLSGRGGY